MRVQERRTGDRSKQPPLGRRRSLPPQRAEEDVQRKLWPFRERPAGQSCCRYDNTESLTCEVKVLVLEALAPPSSLWNNQQGDLLKLGVGRSSLDLTHRVKFSFPSFFFIHHRKERSTELQFLEVIAQKETLQEAKHLGQAFKLQVPVRVQFYFRGFLAPHRLSALDSVQSDPALPCVVIPHVQIIKIFQR